MRPSASPGVINVPVPQIPGPIVEAVKHIPQEWVRQRVCTTYRPLRVEDIGEVLPGRISEPIVDRVPVGKHHQPLDHPDRAKGTGSSTELFSGQTVGVLVLMQRFQLQSH